MIHISIVELVGLDSYALNYMCSDYIVVDKDLCAVICTCICNCISGMSNSCLLLM